MRVGRGRSETATVARSDEWDEGVGATVRGRRVGDNGGAGEWDVSETEDKMMDGPSPPLGARRARSEGVPTLTTMLTLMSKI